MRLGCSDQFYMKKIRHLVRYVAELHVESDGDGVHVLECPYRACAVSAPPNG